MSRGKRASVYGFDNTSNRFHCIEKELVTPPYLLHLLSIELRLWPSDLKPGRNSKSTPVLDHSSASVEKSSAPFEQLESVGSQHVRLSCR